MARIGLVGVGEEPRRIAIRPDAAVTMPWSYTSGTCPGCGVCAADGLRVRVSRSWTVTVCHSCREAVPADRAGKLQWLKAKGVPVSSDSE